MKLDRIYPNDKSIKKQTIKHHLKRYQFASLIIKKTNQLVKAEKKLRTLDLCSGSGYGVEMLRLVGNDSAGVDFNKEAIEYSREHFPKCKFVLQDVRKFHFKGKYDLITWFEAMEYLPFSDVYKLLNKIKKHLKKDGFFMCSNPRDVNSKYNEDHKSQWGYSEMKNVIGSLFDIKILGQDWDTAVFSTVNVIDNDFYFLIAQK